jgi:hypothetical protein
LTLLQFYFSYLLNDIKPEPVSAILFLPKSEQNVPSPMRLVVVRLDTNMYAIRFIVLFLFVYNKILVFTNIILPKYVAKINKVSLIPNYF